jgi:peroxiredoxin
MFLTGANEAPIILKYNIPTSWYSVLEGGKYMRLLTGQTAPDFRVEDIYSQSIDLRDYKGHKLMISFYRFSACPFCNMRVNKLMYASAAYEVKGLKMISFWQSPKESILEHVGKKNPPFPMIPDPTKEIYKLYRVEKTGRIPSGTDGYDFHSRYFWPWSGTDEDPVTGGTHTFLAKYWSSRLGMTKMKSFQASKRTGSMEVELIDDQLLIRGHAVIVSEVICRANE